MKENVREWLKSMHLRPVYTLDEGADPRAYIAVSYKHDGFIMLLAVDGHSRRKVTYNQRGTIFPYSDVEIATDTLFGTQVARKRAELKGIYEEDE